MRDLLSELTWRGLVHDQTPGLLDRLAKGPITGYVGFDPTAPSLQVGNLVPIMLLAHLQRAGGKPLVVMGAGTGMIGDPSGKDAERPLLSVEAIRANAEHMGAQLQGFLEFGDGPGAAELIDNSSWLAHLDLVSFLRDVGKHFTISYMTQKESVRSRVEVGISYTEFSYMLLQAYDFLQLYRNNGCELQMGGSDQWGNITAGIELIRRSLGGEAHGLSAPLITMASGAKFGKTEGGTLWLDASMTSPYQFYQYWINIDDRDVDGYLKTFTYLSQEEITVLMQQHANEPGARIPHRTLALDVCTRVHGGEAAESAARASEVIFGELDPHMAPDDTWEVLAAELPSGRLPDGFSDDSPVVDLVAASGVVRSKGEARRQIEQGGISVNGKRVRSVSSAAGAPLAGRYYWVQRGKKTHAITEKRP